MFADLRYRLRALFNRGDMERELDEELRFHIEHETEKYLRAGVPREEAERRARASFGGLNRIKDDARDARGVAALDSLGQDFRYASRGLRNNLAFTSAVVLTIGLGIGANAAMFGVVDRLLFRAPAFLKAPDRVNRAFVSYTWNGSLQTERSFAYKRYLDFTQWTSSFEKMAAVADRDLAVGLGEESREMNVVAASASFFDFFDARPALGRFFTPDEDRMPNGTAVVVLSHAFWQTRYGARADVLGKTLHIDKDVFTIIGVAPERFVGVTEEAAAPAAFVPITFFAHSRSQDYYQNYSWSWLEIIGRRRAGVSDAAASADLTAAFTRSWEAERELEPRLGLASKAQVRGKAASLHLSRGPDARADSKVATWVMGVTVIVLLVACANVANLLLTRAVVRRREIALRLALGVTRARLLQQLLAESLLLATIGGAAGLAIAHWGGRTIRSLFLPADDSASVISDGRTLLFTGLVTLGVALLMGLAPAMHTLRQEVNSALKAGAREGGARHSRLRTSLLVFQGALSVVLLVGAGLFVRSLSHVRAIRLGYDVEPIVYLEGHARGVKLSKEETLALNERLLAAAAGTPGVHTVTLAISVPFYSSEGHGPPYVPGVDSVRKLGRFTTQGATTDYFRTVGTRIVRGRAFTDADRAGSPPVVIVSDGMAKALWPGKDALGQIMRVGSDTAPFRTVVGIAEDLRAHQLTGAPEFWYYMPMAQYVAQFGAPLPAFFARVSGDAADYVEVLRRRLQREMPGAAYVTGMPMRTFIAPRQRAWQFGATMFVAFGGLALVLAAIGLYSVIAYAVAQRTRELGVRIALGATMSNVMGLVVKQGLVFAVAGLAIGSMLALWAGHWVEPLLFAQKARDPLVYAVVAGVLLLVAIIATLRPALRATRVNPTEALRSE